MKLRLLLLFVFGTSILAMGQPTMPKAEKEYHKRIKKEKLYGVYIPADLAECFSELNKLTSSDSRNKFKTQPEKDIHRKLYFSLGRWIRYNWGFREGSRLTAKLNRFGVYHPDDMSEMIIRTYHRYLNKKDLELKLLVEEIVANRQQIIANKKKNKQ